jgi:hypothetical protein
VQEFRYVTDAEAAKLQQEKDGQKAAGAAAKRGATTEQQPTQAKADNATDVKK